MPENNKGINLVPQILTNDSEGFILTAKKLKDLGYNEINLNLGCPSGTVVGKKRGSGFLAHREELDKFLEEIRQDFYGNKPNLEVFKDAISLSKNPVCYNGDIFTLEDHNKLIETFKEVDKIMLGRGILANPALMNEILNNEFMDKKILKEFHDEVFSKYREVFNEDRNAMFRMKELWGYMIYMFSNNKKYAKKIKKAQKVVDYNQAVTSLFLEQDILKGAGLFSSEE